MGIVLQYRSGHVSTFPRFSEVVLRRDECGLLIEYPPTRPDQDALFERSWAAAVFQMASVFPQIGLGLLPSVDGWILKSHTCTRWIGAEDRGKQ